MTDGANTFKFGDNHLTNKTRDDLNKALEAAFYPKDLMTTPYNPIVVNTSGKLIVIDTGTGEAAYERSKGVTGQFQTNLKAAGHRPQRSRHGDHLAFPRRSHQRADHGRTRSLPIRTPRSSCRPRLEVLHGRR